MDFLVSIHAYRPVYCEDDSGSTSFTPSHHTTHSDTLITSP